MEAYTSYHIELEPASVSRGLLSILNGQHGGGRPLNRADIPEPVPSQGQQHSRGDEHPRQQNCPQSRIMSSKWQNKEIKYKLMAKREPEHMLLPLTGVEEHD